MGLLSFVIVITQLEHLRENSMPILLIECYGSSSGRVIARRDHASHSECLTYMGQRNWCRTCIADKRGRRSHVTRLRTSQKLADPELDQDWRGSDHPNRYLLGGRHCDSAAP